jgi:hypothetical protein
MGFKAMMKAEDDVVTGGHNKLQSAIANVTPACVLAEQHRKKTEPGSVSKHWIILSRLRVGTPESSAWTIGGTRPFAGSSHVALRLRQYVGRSSS